MRNFKKMLNQNKQPFQSYSIAYLFFHLCGYYICLGVWAERHHGEWNQQYSDDYGFHHSVQKTNLTRIAQSEVKVSPFATVEEVANYGTSVTSNGFDAILNIFEGL